MLAVGIVPVRPAQAEAPLDVAGTLAGTPLGPRIALFEDETGRLDIADVAAPAFATRFRTTDADAPNYGFSGSARWVRLEVVNGSAEATQWLLELGYPMLDDVRLYVPRATGGWDVRRAGDSYPFSERELPSRAFVFALEEPAHGARTYYLRVETSSVMNLPLVAWSTMEFLEHQHIDWSLLCVFYGVMLVMAAYNLCVFLFTKQRDFMYYAGYTLALLALQFTLAGHTFQFLLPDHPALMHRLVPATISMALLWVCVLLSRNLAPDSRPRRFYGVLICFYGALTILSFVVPYVVLIRLLALSFLLIPAATACFLYVLIRRGIPDAKAVVIVWGSILLAGVVTALHAIGLLPTSFVTSWALQIGGSLQLVLMSAVLADKLNLARAELTAVNGELSAQLGALSNALNRAEEVTEQAQRATRQKDEFMATMSHEFRTPLNIIINVPQGLLEDFESVRGARCSGCGSAFELDEGEMLTADTACPECAAVGTLAAHAPLRFAGDAKATRGHLARVERAGVHLLQVVNGILDFSKIAAGHLKLTRERIDGRTLLDEVRAETAMPAARASIDLSFEAPADCTLYIDAQRVRQVLVALIGNALKFSPPRTEVHVQITREAEQWVLSVRDQGIGIARENHEGIFASFEQVHKGNTRKYGGAGLGLSIARSLVRMHGGELWVESELGCGSTFSFSLPDAISVPVRTSTRPERAPLQSLP